IVLASLHLLRTPGYGYGLLEQLASAGFPTDANTLYPLLRRLEKQGFLDSEWNTDEARPRKFYRTSEAGVRLAATLTQEVDAVDARTEQGEPLEAAERAVLSELGDPSILAAGYADRPLHLIGPKYFLTWWRLLKVLVAIVPACAFGGVVIAQALAGGGIGQI